jgi:hypothetical protein
MGYLVGLYLYLSLAGIVLLALLVWLSPFGRIIDMVFMFGAAYVLRQIGRRLFGSKDPRLA